MTIQNRYEFVYLFDVTNGNPNGDPDAGNMPRLDPESSKGLVTDVCLKRKIRNFIEMTESESAGFDIYVKEKTIAINQNKRAYEALGIKPIEKELPKDQKIAAEITSWMCTNFYDVRTFGAVMSIKVNAGQVRGPVQFAFAKSIDPIIPLEIAITRSASISEADVKSKNKDEEDSKVERGRMGRKHIVPYGLYRAHGFVSANLAVKTGFSEGDLGKLWESLMMMFDHDRSAARGEMAARHLIIFKHATALGNVPAHQLFDRVTVERVHGESGSPAAQFSDYAVKVDGEVLKQYRKDVEVV